MFDIKQYCNNGNYIEIVFEDYPNCIDIKDKVFFKMLQNMKNKNYHGFQKHYKEYIFRNITYENNDKNEIKIFKKTLTKHDNLLENIRVLVFYKEKLPYHVFPSTTKIHSVSYISKAIFKINNRVYLNFERKKYEGCSTFFNKVYINYNHDENVDLTTIQAAISSCIQLVS